MLSSRLVSSYALVLFFASAQFASAQLYLIPTPESFPNLLNPVQSGTFDGSTGTWSAFANQMANVSVATPATSSSGSALRLANPATTGGNASTAMAVSSQSNIYGNPCDATISMLYRIYMTGVSAGDLSTHNLDISSDGGATWSTKYSVTSDYLATHFGTSGSYTTVGAALSHEDASRHFKYRLRNEKAANSSGNFEVYVDNVAMNFPRCPVDPGLLLHFNTGEKNCGTSMQWSHTESGAYQKVIVQKSYDSEDFTDLGEQVFIAGQHSYNFEEKHTDNLKAYYRLKLITSDGKNTFSVINAVNNRCSEPVVNVYPNPTNDRLTIKLGDAADKITVTAYSTNGGRVLSQQFSSTDFMQIDTSRLAAGSYVLSINTGAKTFNQAILVRH